MNIKSKLVFILKLVFSLYLGAAVGYIINSLGSTKTDYFLKAIIPTNLYHEIVIGNPIVILFTAIGLIFLFLFK